MPGSRERLALRRHLTGIQEYGAAEIAPDLLPQFDRSGRDCRAARRLAVGELRTKRLVAVAADGGRTAGIEALVWWQIEGINRRDFTDQAAEGNDAVAVAQHVDIGRACRLHDRERRTGLAE